MDQSLKLIPFFKVELRHQFMSGYAFWGYGIGIFLNLLIYYFTSKAFLPSNSVSNVFLSKGYFEFIILGELALIIPQVSIGEGQEAFFRYKESGALEQLYFSRLGLIKSFVNVYFSLISLKFVFIVLSLLMCMVFFNISLNLKMIILFILFQLFSSIIFLSFYFFNLSLSSLIGKRNGSLQQLVNVLSFFSGAYFPIEIFSSTALRNILYHSPFALHVKLMRGLVYQNSAGSFSDLLAYFSWCFIMLLIAYALFYFSSKKRLGSLLC